MLTIPDEFIIIVTFFLSTVICEFTRKKTSENKEYEKIQNNGETNRYGVLNSSVFCAGNQMINKSDAQCTVNIFSSYFVIYYTVIIVVKKKLAIDKNS